MFKIIMIMKDQATSFHWKIKLPAIDDYEVCSKQKNISQSLISFFVPKLPPNVCKVCNELEWYWTYMVPATRVLMWVILSGKSFAKPKSPILGTRSLSSKMLLALISRWTIRGSDSSWRNARPEAVPIQIVAFWTNPAKCTFSFDLPGQKGSESFLKSFIFLSIKIYKCAD